MSLTEMRTEQSVSLEIVSRCIEIAIDVVKSDYSLRIPRTAEDRRDGFVAWLEKRRGKLEPAILAAICKEIPAFCITEHPGRTTDLFAQSIWPKVENYLVEYAILGLANSWISHHLWDTTTRQWPERVPEGWRVSIGVLRVGDNLGQVILDRDGNVIPHLTSTLDQIRAQIHDREVSSPATASGQQ